MKPADEERIAARLAKLMAMICVRNTGIEELHAGTVPVTHTGTIRTFSSPMPPAARFHGLTRPISTTTRYET